MTRKSVFEFETKEKIPYFTNLQVREGRGRAVILRIFLGCLSCLLLRLFNSAADKNYYFFFFLFD